MTISEKSAYLKGLAEGMKLDTEKAEGRLISELIGLVSEIATAVETVDNDVSELYDYVDELDQDLADVEEAVFELEDDEELDDEDYDYGEYDECDGECDGCCGCDDIDETEDVFDIEAEGLRCIICENCGDTVCFDESRDPKEIICPGCSKPVVKSEE
ncbi:MAG: hypothetical protein PUC29_04790 [Clostridia bacterium]|nr:hypothetical protein [Clostridia bacterium]